MSGRLVVDGSPEVLQPVDEHAGENRMLMTFVPLDSGGDCSGEPPAGWYEAC